MTSRLSPYGSAQNVQIVAKVANSEGKVLRILADRMPSPDRAAMVGKGKTPGSLADRMPSANIAAKVGMQDRMTGTVTHRLVRLKAQG